MRRSAGAGSQVSGNHLRLLSTIEERASETGGAAGDAASSKQCCARHCLRSLLHQIGVGPVGHGLGPVVVVLIAFVAHGTLRLRSKASQASTKSEREAERIVRA